jgi:hypothetical protein
VDVKRARKRLVQLQSAYDKKQAKAYKNMFSRMSKMEEKECKRAQRPAAEASASVPPAPASTSED